MEPPIVGVIKLKLNAILYVGRHFPKVAFLLGVFMSGYAYVHYDRMTIFEVEAHGE